MTINDFIAWADRLAQEEAAFNAEARKWKPMQPRFGDPLQAVFDLSGSRKFERIGHYLREARKEAGG